MTVWVLLVIVAFLIAINVFLWKSGFLFQAERPTLVEDQPVKNPKERKAFLKRLQRWKEEGRISRSEFEKFTQLSEEAWDLKS